MPQRNSRILGVVLASTLALVTAFPALAGNSMMPTSLQPGDITAAPMPNKSSNFTFVPASTASANAPASLMPLPAREVAAPIMIDPARQGYGQDYNEATAQTLPGAIPVAAVEDGSSARSLNPAAPPIANNMLPANVPANTRVGNRVQSTIDTLADGQSFSGLIAQPQQAGFYTVVARTQAEFADIWRNHIGQEPPPEQLEAGQVAVFATTGPQSYNGYGATLKQTYMSGQKVQVVATEISPSPTVAQVRVDNSPWQILIVRTGDAKLDLLRRRELAGSTVN